MKKCSICGYTTRDDTTVVCPCCGAPVDYAGPNPPAAEPSAQQAPLVNDASVTADEDTPGLKSRLAELKKSSRPSPAPSDKSGLNQSKLTLILLIVVALLLAACLLVLLLRKPGGDAASGAPGFGTGTALNEGDGNAPAQTGDGAPAAAVASETEVVFRNALPDATITADGVPVEFYYVGSDAVVARDQLKDICQVRIVAPAGGDACQTAAVWYNYHYGNDMTFGDENDYGGYVPCDSTGLGEPGAKVVDVLTWAYYNGFLHCINDQNLSSMVYSTDSNTVQQADSIFSDANSKNEYDTSDFSAVCEPGSIQYEEGRVLYNATFVSHATNRSTGEQSTGTTHRTMELIWEGNMWKVSRTAFLSDEDFNAGRYAELP